jgi:hypothetical protein
VSVFNNSGIPTFDFYDAAHVGTAGHAPDTTSGNVGVEVIFNTGNNPVSSRTLVGAIYTNASSITDAVNNRTLLSWFNRQRKTMQNAFTASRSTASTSLVEINAEIRCNFLCWSDDFVDLNFNGYVDNNTASNYVIVVIGVDVTSGANGNTSAVALSVPGGGGFGFPVGLTDKRSGLAEGAVHFATILGAVGANTGNFQKATGTTGDQFPALQGSIMG